MAKKKRQKKKYLVVLLILLLLAILFSCFKYDKAIVLIINSLRNVRLDNVFLWLAGARLPYIGFGLLVLILMTLLFTFEKKRRWLPHLWIGFFLTVGITFFLKAVTTRIRPYLALSLATPLKALGSSFPSAHAAVAFFVLPLLGKEYPRFKYVWLVFACLITFSRVYFSLHYLSDVIAGAILGYVIGLFFVKIEEKYGHGKKLYEKLKRRKRK